MNTFFLARENYKYTWYRDSMGQRSDIDFYIVSAVLFLSLVDVCLKEELNCLPIIIQSCAF